VSRVLGLLGDVDRFLEADQCVERDRCAREDQPRRDRVGVLDLERPSSVAAAVEQEGGADDHGEADQDRGQLHELAQVVAAERGRQRGGRADPAAAP
jgi:hypothetical protein